MKQEVIEKRLESVQRKSKDRQKQMESLFGEVGCSSHMTEEKVSDSDVPNIICELPGTGEGTIIVGAHYDKVLAGMGAVDNWSGASLLVSLYQSLAEEPRKHTYIFIAFAGEEKGLLGSREYVREHKTLMPHVAAMVNMDTMGLGETEIWQSEADPELTKSAVMISAASGIPVRGMNVDKVGTTDSESFKNAKVPVITFHTLTAQTWHILHNSDDQLKAINQPAYYENYRFVATYVAYLDQR